MTDIVERLRRVAGLGLINGGLMDDAAKEIERLREQLKVAGWSDPEHRKLVEADNRRLRAENTRLSKLVEELQET